MKKNKITKIIITSISAIIIALLIFLILKTNKLQNRIEIITGDDIIDITPLNKEFDFKLFQESLIKSLENQEQSIAVIYAKKNIEILQENNDSQEVVIETTKKLEGNGIIISNDGYILTNKHVVKEKDTEYTVILENQEFIADKIWYDDWLDLAIIKIKVIDPLLPVKIIKIQDTVKIWQIVFALKKDPDIKETIVKMWIINSKNQKFKIENNNVYVGLLKTSTAIEPWFSWWPLVNLNGEIIGINTAIDNVEYWASYSLPINQEFINQTIASIKESWKIIRPYIGIKYEDSPIWIKITEVNEWLPWKNVWLQVNDIIYGINNISVNYNNFLYQLYTFKVNKQIVLNIQRWSHKEEIQITLWAKEDLNNK